jgi:hypothetical protein
LAVLDGSRPEHSVSDSATAAPPAPRRATRGPGGTVGRLTVVDYVGQPAAHGAQAVRRAGLRPGLDRSFGCEPDLIGMIVAQDPPAGSDIARNAMVTLYVAAPEPTTAQVPAGSGSQSDDRSARRAAETELAQADARPPDSKARRPRKPRGTAGATTQVFDWPPEPTAPSERLVKREEPPLVRELVAAVRIGRSAREPPRPNAAAGATFHETGGPGRAGEEVALRLDDVFARATDELPPWRRTYPRRPMATTLRRALAWAGSHRVLATATVAVLSVWVAVAVTGAVASHPSDARGPSAMSQREPDTRFGQTDGAHIPGPMRSARAGTDGPTQTHLRRAAPARRARAKRAQVAGRPRGVSGRSHTNSPRALPPTAVRVPVPSATEQTSGGPFSP